MSLEKIYITHSVPFFSQRITDNWKDHGFSSESEALFWQQRSCGVACFKMVLETFTRIELQPYKNFFSYVQKLVSAGAYLPGVGWIHQKLADQFILHGLHSAVGTTSDLSELILLLQQGALILVSIGVGFIEKNSGHIALVIGYKQNTAGEPTHLILHHSSSHKDLNWESKEIEVENFTKHFSGRFISVQVQK